MSSPPVKYLRYFDFTTYASLNPEKPLPGGSVDVEFNRLKSTTDQTIDRLALIQRDDGGLRDGIITTASLADGSVTTPKLADAAVTSAKLAYNLNLGDIGINNLSVAQNASVNGVFDAFGLLHAHQNFTVDGTANFNGPVGLPFNCVGSAQVIDGSLQTADLSDGIITTPKLADLSVTAAKIAPGAISGGAIPDGAIPGAKLQDNSISTAKLQDGAVTLAKLAPNSVDSSKIVDGSITPSDLNASTIALMTAAGNPRGPWLTNTDYASKDAVTNGSGVFVCITAHHSGVFATDLAAGKWYQTGTIYDQSLNKADVVQFSKVGIGMAPSANPLDMLLNQPAATIAQLSNTDAGAAGSAQFRATNLNTSTDFGTFGSGFTTAGPAVPGYGFINAYGGGLSLNSVAAGPILFSTQNFVRMRLDAAGNLGVGRAAEAWDAGNRAFCLGSAMSLNASTGAGSASASVTCNSYFDGANHRFITANLCGIYNSTNGEHIFYSAPTGAVGAIVAYTEKMRLNAAGNLGIGVNNPTDILQIQRSQNAATSINLTNADPGPGVSANIYLNNGTNYGGMRYTGTGVPIVTGSGDRPNGLLVYCGGKGGMVFSVPDNSAPGLVTSAYSWFMASTEKMRIWPSGGISMGDFFQYGLDPTQPGRLYLHAASAPALVSTYMSGIPSGSAVAYMSAPNGSGIITQDISANTNQAMRVFNPNGNVGAIQTAGATTAFLTSSDGRLKNWNVPQRDFRKLIREIELRDGEFICDPGKRRLMFSAQQVWGTGFTDAIAPPVQRTPEQIACDTSMGTEQSDVWMADMGMFSPLALWGVQDLYQLVADLSARLQAKGI